MYFDFTESPLKKQTKKNQKQTNKKILTKWRNKLIGFKRRRQLENRAGLDGGLSIDGSSVPTN